jgi:integrase
MKTSISVICYKSKILSNGESPIMLRVTKDGKRTLKSLGISINPKQWDFDKNEPKQSYPNRIQLLKLIYNTKLTYQNKLLNIISNNEDFTSETLVNSNENKILPITVEEFYLKLISELKVSGRIGNSYAYLNSYKSLRNFNKGKKLNFMFTHIDHLFLIKYEDYLRANGNKDTTISYYIRTLRSTLNKAIEEKRVIASHDPFQDFKLRRFNTITEKRAISKSDIKLIMELNLDQFHKKQQFAIDIFLFSYFCGGISFVDISNLTELNIQNNKLSYIRQKTKGKVTIPLSENAIKIIAKYHTKPQNYLFPILDINRHITPLQKSNRVHKMCYQVNVSLREVSKNLGFKTQLTTYVARHTFATVLKRSGVATSIISESLGHSSEKVTQIYLDSFENKQIEDAMKNLI